MIGEAKPHEASVRWATPLIILFKSSWQDGLEVRQRHQSIYQS